MDSLPTQPEMKFEEFKKETKAKLNNNAKLTAKDCRNTRTKRANNLIKKDLISYQVLMKFHLPDA